MAKKVPAPFSPGKTIPGGKERQAAAPGPSQIFGKRDTPVRTGSNMIYFSSGNEAELPLRNKDDIILLDDPPRKVGKPGKEILTDSQNLKTGKVNYA